MEQLVVFQIEGKKQQIDALTEEQTQELEKNQEQIEIIILKGNSYSKQFFDRFSEHLKRLKNLKKINGNDIFVGRGKDEIPESLTFLGNSLIGHNILSLDLSNNAVNPFGAEALKPFLKQAHSLRRLFINNGGIGIRGVTQICEGLAEGGTSLEILALARNRAECDGALEVVKALNTLKKLKELHIYQNGIKEKGMQALLGALGENCPELETLDIRDNFVHEQTTAKLVELIVKSEQLHSLNISDCNIQNSQNDEILEALGKVKKLVKLGFNYAELSDKQGQVLLGIVEKHLETLEKLELKGNELKKATKAKFVKLFEAKQRVLGALDSEEEEENEADELQRMFSQLEI